MWKWKIQTVKKWKFFTWNRSVQKHPNQLSYNCIIESCSHLHRPPPRKPQWSGWQEERQPLLWGPARTSTGSPSGAWKYSKGKLSLTKLHWKYLVVLLQWLELTFPSYYRKQPEARTWTTSFEPCHIENFRKRIQRWWNQLRMKHPENHKVGPKPPKQQGSWYCHRKNNLTRY